MVTVLALSLISPAWGAAEPSLGGDWVGGFERDGAWVYIQIHFKQEKAAIEGTYDIPLEFTNDKSLARISLESSRIRFEMPRADQTLLFEGKLEGTTVSGKVLEAGWQSSFRLDRIVKIRTDMYVGTYQLGADHYVHIRSWDEFDPGTLQCIDFRSGQFRTLFPSSETSFFTGPSVLVTHPVETTVQFTVGGQGKATSLSWTQADSAPLVGQRVNLTYEEISFRNGDVTLRGTLILPETKGPHPVVIFVHPAGPRSCKGLFTWAEFFAVYGVAGLTYDKRGVGASSGDWMRSSFQDLAGDALAALQFVKGREDIDAKQIGVWGASQGGWIGPLVASQSSAVTFVISQSGSGVSPEEQELYRSEAWLQADGFSQAEIQKVMALIRSRYECARTGQGWEQLAAVERAAESERWYPYTGGAAGKDDPFWEFWRLIHDYDPVPVLEKVKCPVLAVWGGLDTFVPVEKSVAVWRKSLAQAGNEDVTLKVYPNGDHSLMTAKTGGLKEVPRLNGFVPGYFEMQKDWILRHVRVPR
jgi:dienelactone hydrolase